MLAQRIVESDQRGDLLRQHARYAIPGPAAALNHRAAARAQSVVPLIGALMLPDGLINFRP